MYVPAPQLVQTEDRAAADVVEKNPTAQAVQSVAPAPVTYDPAAQSVHASAPEDSE